MHPPTPTHSQNNAATRTPRSSSSAGSTRSSGGSSARRTPQRTATPRWRGSCRGALYASLARSLHPFIRWRLDWRRENREGKRGRECAPRPFSPVRRITRPLLPPRRPQQTQTPNNTQRTTTHTHANSFGAVLADPEAAWADWQPEYTAAVSGFDRLAGADCMAESFPRLGLAVLAAPEPLHYVALFSHTVGADVVVRGAVKKRALAKKAFDVAVCVALRAVDVCRSAGGAVAGGVGV